MAVESRVLQFTFRALSAVISSTASLPVTLSVAMELLRVKYWRECETGISLSLAVLTMSGRLATAKKYCGSSDTTVNSVCTKIEHNMVT